MRKKGAILLLIALTAFGLAACQRSGTPANSQKEAGEDSTEDFIQLEVSKMDGTPMKMQDILANAELTVFHVWEPSCTSCQDEMRTLGQLSAQYSGRGVQIVGIAKGIYEKQDEEALAAMNKAGTFYTQLLDSEGLKAQLSGNDQEVPFAIFMGQDGRTLDEVSGAQDKAFWEKEIDRYHEKVCVNDHPADCATG